MTTDTVRHEGEFVDGACLRKYPGTGMLERTRDRAPDGHCIESGYGAVTSTGTEILFEPGAACEVMAVLRDTDRKAGPRVEVARVGRDGGMHATGVRLL